MATPTQNPTKPATRPEAAKQADAKPVTELKPVNGATVPNTGVVPAGTAPTKEKDEGEESEQEGRARGVVPHMPICVIWKDPSQPPNKMFVAALLHPRDERVYKVQGRGLGGTRGTLEDEGYPTGPVRVDGPKWVEKRIPEGVQVLGYATILGFPLPQPQD